MRDIYPIFGTKSQEKIYQDRHHRREESKKAYTIKEFVEVD